MGESGSADIEFHSLKHSCHYMGDYPQWEISVMWLPQLSMQFDLMSVTIYIQSSAVNFTVLMLIKHVFGIANHTQNIGYMDSIVSYCVYTHSVAIPLTTIVNERERHN